MTEEAETAMSAAFIDWQCRVVRREFDWVLSFEASRAVVITSPWRIASSGSIAFAGSDHGQKFGRKVAVDGESEANGLLAGHRVISVAVRPMTADLTFRFDNNVAVEIFNHSSGYEAWQAEFPTMAGQQIVTALGGGSLTTYVK